MFELALILLSILYFIFLFYIIYPFIIKREICDRVENYPPISIIIAVRNGEGSLLKLFTHLSKQQYKGELEFIFVDDCSSDQTNSIINSYKLKDSRVRYISSNDGDSSLGFKKRALDAGIKHSKHELLLFTDVDCRPTDLWVKTMVDSLGPKSDYVVGMSYVLKKSSLISIFQSIDFYFLMKSAQALAIMKRPNASSGQSILYRKSLFYSVGGYSRISSFIQGDDTLFLQVIKKYTKSRVSPVINEAGYVIARTENDIFSFIRQRIRWSGDANIIWKFNIIFFIFMVLIFCYSVLLVSTSIYSIFNTSLLYILIPIVGFKFLLELLFLNINQTHPQKFNILEFSFWFIIHPFYIILMGLGSFIASRLSWRGRVL